MNQADSPPSHRRPRLSAVWLIPLLAALIGLWLVFSYLSSQGPVITLELEDAEGINAGKTAVKMRNVQVGVVESVSLSEDLSHTLLSVQMQADTERMLNSDTQFWVVKPRVGREGVSGLSTVLSGAYIELLPGNSSKKAKTFTVKNSPPPEKTGDGLFLKLISEPGTNINNGDPVSFRSLKVGRVVDTTFDPDVELFRHRLFIEKPYDVLVSDSSRFWKVSGIGFQLDARGFQAQLSSLEALLGGGISFSVPDPNMSTGAPVEDDHQFVLHDNQESAKRALYTQTLDYVLLVERSVRGLQAGAPVEYRGIRIGTVEQVPWAFGTEGPNAMTDSPIPVLIRLEPQRVTHQSAIALPSWKSEISQMVENGLRASLKAGNLLTGSLFVDLEFHNNAPATDASPTYRSVPVLPSVDSGGLSKLEDQLHALLKTLNGLPMQDMANNLNSNLKHLSGVTGRIENLLDDPALNALPQQISDNLNALESTLQGWQAGGDGYRELQGTLQKLNRLLDDAEPLLDTLNEQPNALIFQRHPATDTQPRGAQ
ncbi:intermembrane transport protein PqiB [Alcanivorax sp.]|uniref:intermembrane transport protein PqiB n=1 Tax=Alcanivorax sp. TaxID=1872427 RepID=UPI003A9144B4